MQTAGLTEDAWTSLLSMHDGKRIRLPAGSAGAFPLYEPVARQAGPFVLAQVGQSLDGRVATLTGDAQDISGCDGITHLHRCRALVDAVIVGVGTVVADDPSLSVRAVPGKSPVRVVIDCNGRMPERAKMLKDNGARILLVQADDVPVARGCETIRLPRLSNGGLAPLDILRALSELGLERILVEGGANTIARFMDADLVDRLHVSVSPIIIGSGPTGIQFSPIDRLAQARRPVVRVYNIGTDVVFDCGLRSSISDSELSEPLDKAHISIIA